VVLKLPAFAPPPPLIPTSANMIGFPVVR
jgi:hypothetical protein